MTWENILTIVFAVLSVVGSLVSYYFYVRKKIAEAIAKEVDNAEIDGAIGAEKKAEVISQLRKLIPAFLKPFITDNLLDALIEKAFESIENYAKKQIEKKAGKNDENT